MQPKPLPSGGGGGGQTWLSPPRPPPLCPPPNPTSPPPFGYFQHILTVGFTLAPIIKFLLPFGRLFQHIHRFSLKFSPPFARLFLGLGGGGGGDGHFGPPPLQNPVSAPATTDSIQYRYCTVCRGLQLPDGKAGTMTIPVQYQYPVTTGTGNSGEN